MQDNLNLKEKPMSKPDTTSPVSAVPSEIVVVENPSLFRKGVNFVKSHKKTSIAAVALVALVGAGALAGRGGDSTDVSQDIENDDTVDSDTTVA